MIFASKQLAIYTLLGLCVGGSAHNLDKEPHVKTLVTHKPSFTNFNFESEVQPSAFVWVPLAVDNDSCQKNLALMDYEIFPVDTMKSAKDHTTNFLQLFSLKFSNAKFYGLCALDVSSHPNSRSVTKRSKLTFFSKNYTFTPDYGCTIDHEYLKNTTELPLLPGITLSDYEKQHNLEDLSIGDWDHSYSYPLWATVSVNCSRSPYYYMESGSLTVTCNASGLWEISEANAFCKKGCNFDLGYTGWQYIDQNSQCMTDRLSHHEYRQGESCDYRCAEGYHAVQANSQATCTGEEGTDFTTFCKKYQSHWYIYLIIGVVGAIGLAGVGTFLFIKWRKKTAYVPLE